MLTLLVWIVITTFCSGAVAAALLDERRTAATNAASETWTAIKKRNGITATIPFASPDAAINQAGLVRVYPRTQAPTSLSITSTAPVHHPTPLDPLPTKERREEESSEEGLKVSTKKETKMRWGYPQGGFTFPVDTTEPLGALQKLIESGERRKTVLSWAVFGASGGAVYSQARPYIEEALEEHAK